MCLSASELPENRGTPRWRRGCWPLVRRHGLLLAGGPTPDGVHCTTWEASGRRAVVMHFAVLPQHAAGASPGAHVPEGCGTDINDIVCRSAFKDAVLRYNTRPVTPHFAAWRVDIILVAYDQFCCAGSLSRQRLPSFTRNDFGRAHWIPHEDCGCAHRADAGNARSQLYLYPLRGPCLWSFDKRTGPIWGPMCVSEPYY